ncbi:MAG TPA: MMPL family transporter [Miltoncostaeaceae bacterium]|nr:MMPL family transporter [Miltoncostaeaceae bacterium]
MRASDGQGQARGGARPGVLGRLGLLIAGPLRYAVVVAWVVAAVAATLWLPPLGADRDAIGLPIPDDAPALRAEMRSAELFGAPLLARTLAVQRAPQGLGEDDRQRLLDRVLDVNARRDPDLEGIAAAVPLLDDAGVAARPGQEGTTAVTYLLFPPQVSPGRSETLARRFAAPLAGPGTYAGVTGATPSRNQQLDAMEARLPWVVLATVAMIALVVLAALRSWRAPVVTLVAVAVAYAVDLRLIGWVGQRTDASASADLEPVVAALLLGIVTDYALFFLFGAREERAGGAGRREAVGWSAARYIPIVATAGVTVAAGTAALLAGGIGFFRAFGPALALTALVGMAVAATLVPALMAILGGAAPVPPRAARRTRTPLLVRLVTHRGIAAVAVVLAVAALGAAALNLRDMRLGSGLTTGLPAWADARTAADAADAGFPPGVRGPAELLLEGPGVGADPARLRAVERALAEDPGVAAVLGPSALAAVGLRDLLVTPDGAAARLLVVLRDDPTEHRAIATLGRLQERLPPALQAAGVPEASGTFAGDTALARAAVRATAGELVRVGAVAALVNLLLLAVFLRALVAPLYLLAASALSVAAALGLTTYVFQELLGDGQLVYFVPFAAAVLLLALGSDYNIFLVGQIWGEDGSDGMAAAARRAAARAGTPIAVAGLVLAASFALLAAVPVQALRQMAFAMAAGVLIDAFVVRSVLVPAMVALLGDAGRWPGRRPPVTATAVPLARPPAARHVPRG